MPEGRYVDVVSLTRADGGTEAYLTPTLTPTGAILGGTQRIDVGVDAEEMAY